LANHFQFIKQLTAAPGIGAAVFVPHPPALRAATFPQGKALVLRPNGFFHYRGSKKTTVLLPRPPGCFTRETVV